MPLCFCNRLRDLAALRPADVLQGWQVLTPFRFHHLLSWKARNAMLRTLVNKAVRLPGAVLDENCGRSD